ncbi:MAG TPA: type II toxin-antitoxin system VapC family toxin [Hanamia sp.]|nr:type II toxin-antitoxin system VapC family toxin [Hanamia sp.]
MAEEIIMIDTSILIDFYRRTDKNKSMWLSLVRKGYHFAISAITKYEIYSGATRNQLEFWDDVLRLVEVFPFDEATVNTAVEINTNLKRKSKQIDLADLFIAATAISNGLPFATINLKHFERIDGLEIFK